MKTDKTKILQCQALYKCQRLKMSFKEWFEVFMTMGRSNVEG